MKDFHTRQKARNERFESSEVFYNQQRRHSAVGHPTPAECEKRAVLLNQVSTKPGGPKVNRARHKKRNRIEGNNDLLDPRVSSYSEP